jgi:methionyl-tRNA formyltransferase
MKIVFMGTPDFAVPTLQRLIQSQHEISAIVTAPDKPAGRGNKIRKSAIAKTAETYFLPVFKPTNLKDQSFVDRLKTLNADVFVVVAFRILPVEVFTLPTQGTINLHASLLPKYRGAAPINWALIKGEKTTGVSTFFIEEKVDTGKILLQKKVTLNDEITAGELYDRLKELGAELVIETLAQLEQNQLKPKQQEGEPSKAPKVNTETGRIQWQEAARDIHNLIRGLSPIPGCHTFLDGKRIKILRSELVDEHKVHGHPGEVVSADPKDAPIVQTGKGLLKIVELQPAGKRIMTGAEFIRGYRITEKAKFNSNG